MGFVEQGEANAERAIGGLGSRDRLKNKIGRASPIHDLQECRDMSKHAGLHGNLEARTQFVDPFEKQQCPLGAIGGRVDPNAGVATAIHEPIEDRRADAGEIIGRVIGLDSHAKAPRQADGGAKTRHHRNLFRYGDQILVAHELRHRSRHFRRDARRQAGERYAARLVGQKKIPKIPGGHGGDWGKGLLVMRIENEPRHLVPLVRHHGLVEKARQRQIGQRHACRDALLPAFRREPGEPVARAPRRGTREKHPQIVKDVMRAASIASIRHQASCSPE